MLTLRPPRLVSLPPLPFRCSSLSSTPRPWHLAGVATSSRSPQQAGYELLKVLGVSGLSIRLTDEMLRYELTVWPLNPRELWDSQELKQPDIRCLIQIDIWCFRAKGVLLSGERVICGSKGLLMSNCAHVWCCNVKSHIHLDIDRTCFQCFKRVRVLEIL